MANVRYTVGGNDSLLSIGTDLANGDAGRGVSYAMGLRALQDGGTLVDENGAPYDLVRPLSDVYLNIDIPAQWIAERDAARIRTVGSAGSASVPPWGKIALAAALLYAVS